MTASSNKILLVAILIAFLNNEVFGTPKKYVTEEGGFQPSVRYFESNLTPENNKSRKSDLEAKDTDRLERFGYVSSFGNTGNGNSHYGGTGVGNMVPLKIDLGGVVLGALIGLGAILIIPKLTQAFSGHSGYRSLDDENSLITDFLAKIDNTLEQNKIDGTSCMQRIVCSYVHESQKNIQNGAATTVDQVVYSFSNNALFMFVLDGSSFKQAVDMGKQSDLDQCAKLYEKCPLTKDNILQIVGSLLPA